MTDRLFNGSLFIIYNVNCSVFSPSPDEASVAFTDGDNESFCEGFYKPTLSQWVLKHIHAYHMHTHMHTMYMPIPTHVHTVLSVKI